MPALVLFALTGLVAQLVNGSLGMGFGVTSNTVLLSYGIAPAAASASIQMANIVTGTVSGASHWRFGNLSWPLVFQLGVPGAAGAFLGATALSSFEGDWVVPAVAVVLLGLGTVVMVRSLRGDLNLKHVVSGGLRRRFLVPLGAVGGFMNAIGGGGWGPVTTPTLMASGRIEPRYVIGSVSAAEVLVTLSATAGFLIGLSGADGVQMSLVLALMGGGVVSAPFAAYVVGRIRPAKLGVWVGTLLLVLNARTLLGGIGVPSAVVLPVLLVIAASGAALSTRTPRENEASPVDSQPALSAVRSP